MQIPTVTFVTAFIDLNEDRSNDRSPETRISLFKNIAKSGVAICLYVSSKYENIGKDLENEFKNVKLMPITNLEDTEIYKIINKFNPNLPSIITNYHDTLNFMSLINAKSEIVYNASLVNPFNTEYFAWIDFSIFHVIKNIEEAISKLKLFGHSNLKEKFLLFPCCWFPEISKQYIHHITSQVHWRFCGVFFIGDKASVQNMHNLMITQLPNFINHTGTNIIAWEVNFWAWLEVYHDWKIDYYIADHNDSILDIPKSYISVVASLTSIPSRFENCKLTIDSLIQQVDHIYLNLCSKYTRFPEVKQIDINIINEIIPSIFLTEEPYKSKLTITIGNDYGPATKYLGALKYINNSQWIFFCDDDQEYHPNLISKMVNNITNLDVYQNRYNIVKNGSGGIIHGYVGNLIHRSLLNDLPKFDLPDIAKVVDDQWLSVYCKLQNINIYSSGIEEYSDIFNVLENGNEKIGKDSLASLNNRDNKIKELEEYYNVKFIGNGNIINNNNINETITYKSTIVTFYFNITKLKDMTGEHKPQSFYMDKGRETLKLHYPMVIFCDEDNYKEIKLIRDEYVKNPKLTNYIIKNITEYEFYKENWDIINDNRNINKFYNNERYTASYVLITIFKIIAIYIAKQHNFYNTDYYAWIDFGGSHVIRNFNTGSVKMLNNPNPKISLCYIHYRSHDELYPMTKFFNNNIDFCGFASGVFTIEKDYINRFYNGCLSIFHESLCNGVGIAEELIFTYFYDKYPELCNIYYGDYYSVLDNYHEPINDFICIKLFFIDEAIKKGRQDLAEICKNKLITSVKKNNINIESNDLLFLKNILQNDSNESESKFTFTENNTFCIILENNPREINIKRRMEQLEIPYTKWVASTPETLIDNFKSDINNDFVKGCAQSHINIWRHIVKNNLEYALILEDDACFDKSWKIKLANFTNDNNWNCIMLSSSEPVKLLNTWVKASWQYSTIGYIISNKGAKWILEEFKDCFDRSDSMTIALQNHGHCYTHFPWLVIQDGLNTTIGSNIDSDNEKMLTNLNKINYSLDNYII